MEEFVIVVYPTRREVYVDGKRHGYNKKKDGRDRIIRVNSGWHRFRLGEPLDYTPEVRELMVKNTNHISPMRIEFSPKAG